VSLAEWAKRQTDPSIKTALAKLWALPEVEHGVEPPFAVGNKGTYHQGHMGPDGKTRHLSKEIRSAPVIQITMAGLRTIQHSVNPQRVEQYLRDPDMRPAQNRGKTSDGHGGPVDYPIVVQQGGVRYIHDGHHRLTADKLKGDTYAWVRFVNLDAEKPPR
jgi:hypothetical protein